MDSRGRGAVREGQLRCGGTAEHIHTGSFISFRQHSSVISLLGVTCDVLATLRPPPLAAFIALRWRCLVEWLRWGRDSFQLSTGSLGIKLQGRLILGKMAMGRTMKRQTPRFPRKSPGNGLGCSLYTPRELRVSVR